jgi:uncharacterized protein
MRRVLPAAIQHTATPCEDKEISAYGIYLRVTYHFKMTLPKYLNIFLLFFWAVTSTASCRSHADKTKANAKDTQGTSFNRQYFQDSLPKPLKYINDFEYLFTESERQTLDSLLHDFEKRTSIQIVVITIDSTMIPKDSLDAFTLKIANYWGIGQKDKNNGVAIGISRSYKKMRIQNGYGIEKILTDAETKEIIDTAFIPSFRNADYFQGTLTGLKSLMKILEERNK